MTTHTTHLPAEMAAAPRWVNWKPPKKIPICPATNTPAKSTDPTTWATIHSAYQNDPQHLGFCLGNGFACIDLDHCIKTDGTLTRPAAKIAELYPSHYIEISPSGDGLHIWGTAPERKGLATRWEGQAVEMYSRHRYITVTGEVWQRGQLLPL